jgi:uncharacterized membrane protein YdjX (TVP38/TMEM64 family)
MYDALTQWLLGGVELSVNSAILLSLIFFAASFVLIPRTGASFGLLAILIILPSTVVVGGILAFLLARHLFSVRLQDYIDARLRLRRIAAAVERKAGGLWRYCALLLQCRMPFRIIYSV